MKRVVLAFLIDALGWETIARRPFLDALARTRCPLRTVLGFSSGAEPSILTGRPPSEHGRWTMYRLANGTTPFGAARWARLWPSALPGHTRIRDALAWWVRRRQRIEGYFNLYDVPLALLPHFDLAERGSLFEPGGIPESLSLFDELVEEGIPHKAWWWRTSDAENFREVRAAIDSGSGGFYFIYSAALDALQHVEGVGSPATARLLADYDARITSLHDAAKARGLAPLVFVFSDHGMRDTDGTINLMSRIEALGLDVPRDYLAFYDSTMARFWFKAGGSRARIAAALAEESHGRVLTDEELAREGVLFSDRRYGELIFLMNPGWQIEPSFMGPRANRAMHGFHPDDSGSDAAFLSNVEIDPAPSDIKDLHDLLLSAAREASVS